MAVPVPIIMLPVFPELLDPELKKSEPLAPFVPAFKLRITTFPLVDAVPSPDEIRAAPPVAAVLEKRKNCQKSYTKIIV